jgi:hypothetical protein
MNARTWILGVAALGLAGCYDSLVGGKCAEGYEVIDGVCAPVPSGSGADAPIRGGRPDGRMADAAPVPDATPCDVGLDLQTDPDNCGACGHVCASGICSAGACVGATTGHVVVIGHDYAMRHASALRVLGNALALGAHRPVVVGFYRGTADSPRAGANLAAVQDATAAIGLAWHRVDLDQLAGASVDVIVIDSQVGQASVSQQAGAAWTDAAAFVRGGGSVIALGGEGSSTEQVLSSAGLLDATIAAPATGSDLTITATTDAVATGVISPYHADATTSAYHAGRGVVVATDAAGDAVVIDAPAP